MGARQHDVLQAISPAHVFVDDAIDAVGGGDERTSSFLHQAGVDASLHKVRLQESPNNAAEVYAEVPQLEMTPSTLEAAIPV